MKPIDAQQWRFLGRGDLLRPGTTVHLVNDVIGAGVGLDERSLPCWGSPAPLIVTRAGTSDDPIHAGERIGLHLVGFGFLAFVDPCRQVADPQVADPRGRRTQEDGPVLTGVRDGWELEGQWEITGCFTGLGVPFDRPIGLVNLLRGDHLVAWCAQKPPDGPIWSWWALRCGSPAVAFPRELRAVEAVPSDVCLMGEAGRIAPMSGVDGGDRVQGRGGTGGESGVELRVTSGIASSLGLAGPTGTRDGLTSMGTARPQRDGQRSAPQKDRPVVACRWEGHTGAWLADLVLAHGPVLLRVQGILRGETHPTVSPVRSLAWALDGQDTAVLVDGTDPCWPQTTVTWLVARVPVPCEYFFRRRGGAWLLPLPGRDGEPGTSTTVTPVPLVRPTGRTGRGRRRPYGSEALEMPPSIVRDVRTGRRMLRLVLVGSKQSEDAVNRGRGHVSGGQGGRVDTGLAVVGFTVRVHGSAPGGKHGTLG